MTRALSRPARRDRLEPRTAPARHARRTDERVRRRAGEPSARQPLLDPSIDLVITSPLARASATAATLTEACRCPLHVDDASARSITDRGADSPCRRSPGGFQRSCVTTAGIRDRGIWCHRRRGTARRLPPCFRGVGRPAVDGRGSFHGCRQSWGHAGVDVVRGEWRRYRAVQQLRALERRRGVPDVLESSTRRCAPDGLGAAGMNLAALGCAYALDLIAGDPEWLPHPVRAMGRMIAAGESVARPGRHSPTRDLLHGAIVTVIVVSVTVVAALVALRAAHEIHPLVAWLAEALLAWTVLATGSLLAEALRVVRALERGDLVAARGTLAGSSAGIRRHSPSPRSLAA